MESSKRIYCYIYVGGELIQQNDGLWEYVGGRSKGLHICKGISFQEFISRVLQKLGISQDMLKFFYTLKFNPKVLLELEDDDDLDNVVSHSDDFANIYLVESPRVEDVQANTQNASRDVPSIYYSSNASCDAISDPMILSQGFATRCAENDYVPLKSNQYRDAILGSGHTFKNADEFRNAIYLMSLGGRFQYKYKRNSPKQMSVRCLVEGCPWKITANAVVGNEILRVGSYEVNHNHGAQDECSSKMVVSSKRGASVIKEVLRTNPCYPPRQICKDFVREHGLVLTYSQAWHLREKAQQYVFGAPRDSYIFLPWFCHRLREINPGTIAQYTSSESRSPQLIVIK